MNSKLKGSICILFATVIWGSTFVAQSAASEYVAPFTFQGVRSVIGTLFLLVLIAILDFDKKRRGTYTKPTKSENKLLAAGGIVCGIILAAAMNFQQIGVYLGADPGKAGFITTMYILLVPIFGLFLRKRISRRVWLAVALGVVGLFFLCMKEGTGLTFVAADIYLILCAVVFALHIIFVDYYAPKVDGVKLSCVQFLVAGTISIVLMFIFEQPSFDLILKATFPILYAGIGSSGIAYTLQIIGQKSTPPTIASLLMSMESVFDLLTQIVIMQLLPTGRETIGSVVMLCAIIIAQLPTCKKTNGVDNLE